MTDFTRDDLRQIRADFESAFEAVAKKHKLKIDLGKMNFTATNFHAKITASKISKSGVAQSPDAEAFIVMSTTFGLTPEHLGRTFISRGEEYRITGYNIKSYKMPIKVERVRDGAPFKFSTDAIRHAVFA